MSRRVESGVSRCSHSHSLSSSRNAIQGAIEHRNAMSRSWEARPRPNISKGSRGIHMIDSLAGLAFEVASASSVSRHESISMRCPVVCAMVCAQRRLPHGVGEPSAVGSTSPRRFCRTQHRGLVTRSGSERIAMASRGARHIATDVPPIVRQSRWCSSRQTDRPQVLRVQSAVR